MFEQKRFEAMIRMVDQIPSREFGQNSFGEVCTTATGKCQTRGCVGFHVARRFPDWGIAALYMPVERAYQLRGAYDGYKHNEPIGALAHVFGITMDEARLLFDGADESDSKPEKQRAEMKKRLASFYEKKTGEKWRKPARRSTTKTKRRTKALAR